MAHMPADAETPFQAFVAAAIARLPEARNYYDRILQDRLKTSGKPLYDIARKGHRPKTEMMRAIADVLQQPIELFERAWEGEAVKPVEVGRGRTGLQSDVTPTRSVDGGDTVEIIRLDLSLPMGPGATVDEYVEEEPVVFDLAYIRAFTRTPPSRLRLARGIGESMYPTLNNNDLVWIDSTQRDLNQSDRVWAVSINGAAAIKRLRPLRAGKVLVISDNPAIGNYEVDHDELVIGGRVIRFARDL